MTRAGAVALLAAGLLTSCTAHPGASSAPGTVRTLAQDADRGATAENSQRKLVVTADGHLYLTYVAKIGEQTRIIVLDSATRGLSWRRTVPLSTTVPVRLPSLAAFSDGSVHLVWTAYGPVGRVFHQVRRGGRWFQGEPVSPSSVYGGVPVVVPSAGPAGVQPHVVWYGIRPETPEVRTPHSSIYEILSSRREAGGWSLPVLVSSGIPDSLNPSAAVDGRGVLHTAWYQFDARTYQVRYSRGSVGWDTPRTLTVGRVDHTEVSLAVGKDSVHVVWREGSNPARVMYRRLAGETVRLSGNGDAQTPVIAAAGQVVAAAWVEDGRIVVRRVHPSARPIIIEAGEGPAIALHGDVIYLAWVRSSPSSRELRFTVLPVR